MWGTLERLLTDPWNLLEAAILSVLLWGLLTVVRGTRGEGMLRALGLFLGITFLILRSVAVGLHLDRLILVLDAIFQASVVALVVIFQPELRRGLAIKIGQRWLSTDANDTQLINEIVNAACRMSEGRVGALIAFQREDNLEGYTANSVILDALPHADTIVTVFWPGSPLHDQALLIRDGRLWAAKCTLPNTDDPNVPRSLGTRHRAAIGLSEHSDALVVVVSEETGIISVAEAGQLTREFDRESLTEYLTQHYIGRPEASPPAGDEQQEDPDDLQSRSTTRVVRRKVSS